MPLHVRMSSRDPDERHRSSSPLELFFDLTFVVAVSEAGSGLQPGLVGARAESVLLGYPLVFFAIWWAWMNCSWFASAYEMREGVVGASQVALQKQEALGGRPIRLPVCSTITSIFGHTS